MNALEIIMPVLIEHGFTLKQTVEILAQFMEEEIPLYLECTAEENGSTYPLCSQEA